MRMQHSIHHNPRVQDGCCRAFHVDLSPPFSTTWRLFLSRQSIVARGSNLGISIPRPPHFQRSETSTRVLTPPVSSRSKMRKILDHGLITIRGEGMDIPESSIFFSVPLFIKEETTACLVPNFLATSCASTPIVSADLGERGYGARLTKAQQSQVRNTPRVLPALFRKKKCILYMKLMV